MHINKTTKDIINLSKIYRLLTDKIGDLVINNSVRLGKIYLVQNFRGIKTDKISNSKLFSTEQKIYD
jgi:large exoprotein involved in heme utilization and adhesion